MTGRANRAMKSRLWWILASVAGAVAGAALARLLFTSARFGAQQIGQLTGHTLLFPATIGLALGLSQWLVLRRLPEHPGAATRIGRKFWAPLTALGIVAMILPLYWVDVLLIVGNPFTLPIVMAPGLVLVALLQGLMIPARHWIPWTVWGGLLGSMLAEPVAYMGMSDLEKLAIDPAFPVEITFSSVVGFFIGLFQSTPFARLSSQTKGD